MDDDAARHTSREGLAALEAELRELELDVAPCSMPGCHETQRLGELEQGNEHQISLELPDHSRRT